MFLFRLEPQTAGPEGREPRGPHGLLGGDGQATAWEQPFPAGRHQDGDDTQPHSDTGPSW